MATRYLVLLQIKPPAAGTRAAYEPIQEVEAASAPAAIRAAVERLAEVGETQVGTYVAVPARSWSEQQVSVESKPRITLADPAAKPTLVAQSGGPSPARAEAQASSTVDPPNARKAESG